MFKQKAAVRQNRPDYLGAPLAGINATAPLLSLRENEALVLENFFPAPDGLTLRPGYTNHTYDLPDPVDRLWTYSVSTGGEKLFATTDSGVFDVSSSGIAGSAVIALTEGETSSTSISTGAGSYMFLANGVDTVKLYDGTTWSSVATFGALATDTLSYVETYRQRVYFVKRNSLELEYLGANSVSGATTNYPLGAIFRRGGYIVGLATWTLDGGTGADDQLVVMTSQGEVAVFAGSLPSDPTLWAERGVYFLGKPLGKNPFFKWGGDLYIITENGLYPMSSAVQSTAITRTQAISNRITPLINTAAGLYRSSQGWQIIADPQAPYLLVNVPSSPLRKQFVMNLETKAWCTFTGWEARCFARRGNQIYFGTNAEVMLVGGINDEGVNIRATFVQAPTRLGIPVNKKIELIRSYILQDGGFQYSYGIGGDLQEPREYNELNATGNLTGAIWGLSRYGDAEWTGITGIIQDWRSVIDDYSLWKSLYFSITSNNATISYYGSDLLLGTGGSL